MTILPGLMSGGPPGNGFTSLQVTGFAPMAILPGLISGGPPGNGFMSPVGDMYGGILGVGVNGGVGLPGMPGEC